MAVQADSGGKDEVKTQFATREGTYRLMTLSEYSRPNRVGYNGGSGSSQVRVSLVTLPPPPGPVEPGTEPPPPEDRICFNHGKELYVYVYKGIKKAADLTKPVDKKMYKGTNPTCHDFNTVTMTSDSVSLLIGFSTGQIQLIDPIKKELSKLYNEERLIDKTRVTCIRWVPGSSNLFCAAHASGQLYVYNEQLGCGPGAPHYQPFKAGDGFSVHTCRARATRNPLYRWALAGAPCINEFAFSPCGAHLAVASQDGLLRVFRYNTMELVGRARSYFGGFLCACWSPDGQYAVAGGEDDLVTVWSLGARRVVARGQGHRSWVSVVAFDPWAPAYRLGSVAQDTQLCLWDLTEDVLRPAPPAPRARAAPPAPPAPPNGALPEPPPPAPPSLSQRLAGFSFGERRSEHRRNFSLGKQQGEHKASGAGGAGAGAGGAEAGAADPLRLIGTGACPRFDECPVLEPLVCKKIAHERLTALQFRADYFVTACADGCVSTWARPAPPRAPLPPRADPPDRADPADPPPPAEPAD